MADGGVNTGGSPFETHGMANNVGEATKCVDLVEVVVRACLRPLAPWYAHLYLNLLLADDLGQPFFRPVQRRVLHPCEHRRLRAVPDLEQLLVAEVLGGDPADLIRERLWGAVRVGSGRAPLVVKVVVLDLDGCTGPLASAGLVVARESVNRLRPLLHDVPRNQQLHLIVRYGVARVPVFLRQMQVADLDHAVVLPARDARDLQHRSDARVRQLRARRRQRPLDACARAVRGVLLLALAASVNEHQRQQQQQQRQAPHRGLVRVHSTRVRLSPSDEGTQVRSSQRSR